MLFPVFYGFIAPDIAHTKSLNAIVTAIGLVAKLDAQLSVAIGAIRISVPNPLGSKTVEALVAEEHRRCMASAAAAREQITGHAKASGITVHTEEVRGDFGQIRRSFANRARVHGLVFAEAGIPGDHLGRPLIEALLFESGRPVIVVPNGYASQISCDHVLIAWDGSTGAARAVWDSLPLLRLAKTIEIVTIEGEKDLQNVPAANTLAPMLSYLGKKMQVTVLPFDGGTTSGPIKTHAARTGAGLIIQGAYGRSRLSELVLGGVTREMLTDSTLPVVMSH